jgi:D-alanyl-lipoteichoic acid acyltransferase DltB (MBOAT superfamily)
VLLAASYGFYASFKAPYLLAVLFMVTCISYACGLRIVSEQHEAGKKRWLWSGVIACVATLAALKYLPFLESQTNRIFGLSSTLSATIISIGVSYFTFQAISYLADVYLEIEEPEKHFGLFALYLAFFPKLLQGPIERAGDLLPQLKENYRFEYDAMRSGMLLFTWGLFKKVVIADRLALFVNPVFSDVHSYSGISMLFAVYMYAAQIFFDFSGYTDMARGIAGMFGIRLTENFNSPYLATSIADFWRRWHISFSRWILDYIFKPLQMSLRGWKTWGTTTALIIAFFISGLWHGSTWGFVVWGLLHGCFLASSVVYKPFQKKIHQMLGLEKSSLLRLWQIFVTFHLVCLSWIFFRAESISDALYCVENLFSAGGGIGPLINKKQTELMILVGMLSSMVVVSTVSRREDIQRAWYHGFVMFRWMGYVALLTVLLLFNCDSGKAFIYFRF